MKVLCIGLAAYNITSRIDTFPVEGNKSKIQEKLENGGGFAYDAAYLLANWGAETYISAIVGSDDYGNKIRKELEQNNVKTDFLETSYDRPTSVALVLVNKTNGSTTSFDLTYEKAHIKKEVWSIEPDYILGDSSEYHAFITAINKFPNKDSFVYAEKNDLETKEICKYAKYILGSLDFAVDETKVQVDFDNPSTLEELYNKLLNRYPRSKIVITLGTHGALFSKDNKICLMQGLGLTPADASGSSNIFRAAFVYAVSVGYDLEKCMRIANIAAGLSVQKLGNKSSIPPLNEVLAYYTKQFANQQYVVPNIDSDIITEETSQPASNEGQPESLDANNVQTDNPQPSPNASSESVPVENVAPVGNADNPGVNPPSANA
jgi:sugar/nucleoside kinase (ribokinase family)